MNFRSHVNRILSLSTETFGEEVTFYLRSGRVKTVRAIFDNEFKLVDLDTEQLVSANQPRLGVNLNDFPEEDLRKGDSVIIRSIRFKITDKQEDGQGGATLFVQKERRNDKLSDTRAIETED